MKYTDLNQGWLKKVTKILYRNVYRKALFHLWMWQQTANLSCLKTIKHMHIWFFNSIFTRC